jgi:membrane associated rhomboid family serine protease
MERCCARQVLAVYSTMFGVTTSDDYRPVAWIGRYPVRVITIITALYVLGMFATVALQTANSNFLVFAFTYPTFIQGAFWQPLTCTFIQTANFFFLFNVLFLYWSGRELETFLGRRHFIQLFVLLLLIPPVVISAWAPFGKEWLYFGSYEVCIGMFIAFATLYPNVEMFGWVTLKWLAFAGIILGTMQDLPNHSWGNLTVLWVMCAAAFLYIRFVQGRMPINLNLERFNPFRRKPRLTIVQKSSTRRVVEPEDVYASVDPILDKIAKSGIGSLTASERRALDRARARLLKKDSD